MIDIHCHILPYIDDGSKNLEESLEMARQYVEEGFVDVIATPHWDEHASTELLKETSVAFSMLRNALLEEGIPLNISLGNEFYITPQLHNAIEDELGNTLCESRYVLVELPMIGYPLYADYALHQLQIRGLIPIIAHPERYHYVRKDPNMVYEWIRKGMFIQMNLPSIANLYGKDVQNTSKVLLEYGMVHFLATDSHSTGKRSPRIMELVRRSDILTKDDLHLYLRENPRIILDNKTFVPEEPRFYRKRQRFLLW